MISARAYDLHVDQLFEKLRRIHGALSAAGIPYRIIGGVAIFLHVSERDPDKARMTRDLDLAVFRDDLQKITAAAERAGFRHRRAAGLEMLVEGAADRAGSAIHFTFAGEKVRSADFEPVPFSDPVASAEGMLLASVADLVHMKLTSFRLKDKVHVQDMDSVGLITSDIEQSLPELLRDRLKEVRATE
jgi:hypothetical protein